MYNEKEHIFLSLKGNNKFETISSEFHNGGKATVEKIPGSVVRRKKKNSKEKDCENQGLEQGS